VHKSNAVIRIDPNRTYHDEPRHQEIAQAASGYRGFVMREAYVN
jgi:hypothetical protein